MKDNILFWISKDLLHFGIANSLQKNNGANLYAIIESFDKPKKFFQNQKFVNFKKTWYLDNLTTSKKHPDIEFLKSKENHLLKINEKQAPPISLFLIIKLPL